MGRSQDYMFPTSLKELERLAWDHIDVILFCGDAFVDHPSFGAAVIARHLQSLGYLVAVVPQPNWRDDLRDFRKFGAPRLFFGVTSGAMDSMVNHYTANKRLRSDDAYTPDGKAGRRPDYAVRTYTRILKRLYPDVPVVIGGIEASLRRLTHYDYWQDALLPSILVESGADCLIYGMGERPVAEVASAIDGGCSLLHIPQTAHYIMSAGEVPSGDDTVFLSSHEECLADKKVFVRNFNIIETEANKLCPKTIVEPCGNGFVVVNPPYPPACEREMDSWYALPYTRLPHPRYAGKTIPAYEMIKNSITVHRGCFGGCSFCTIAAHQGKFIQSRSMESVVDEVKILAGHPSFKGVISDIGAPTANMYRMGGKDFSRCAACVRKSCLYPRRCPNLDCSHADLLKLYSLVDSVPGVRKSFIGSGIRYDLFLDGEGYIDASGKEYFEEVVLRHTSGRFKVAPEHTEQSVLDMMNKPPFRLFGTLRREFSSIVRKHGLKYSIVPYFISGHPGCGVREMKALASNPLLNGINLDQVQEFTPTPMTASSVQYYSCMDLRTMKSVFVEKSIEGKKRQKSFFYKNARFSDEIRKKTL